MCVCVCSLIPSSLPRPVELQSVTYGVFGSSGLHGIEDRVYETRPGWVHVHVHVDVYDKESYLNIIGTASVVSRHGNE